MTMDMPQLQVKAISYSSFLKSLEVTQKGITLKQTVKHSTFTMKVLCTPLLNSQKKNFIENPH